MGSIVCKAERELEDDPLTGYIAMLAVDTTFRKHGIGKDLSLSLFLSACLSLGLLPPFPLSVSLPLSNT